MGFDRLEGIREYGITMKLSFGINDRVARVQGLLCAGFSQALCAGARLRRIAMCQGSIFRLARFGGVTAIAAGVLIGLDGCRTKPQSSEQSDVPSSATFSQVPQAGTTTNHQKLAEAMRDTDHAVASQAGTGTNQPGSAASEALVLREGDTVRVS